MKYSHFYILISITLLLACNMTETNHSDQWQLSAVETSASGKRLDALSYHDKSPQDRSSFYSIELFPEERFQEIIGFGGSFTEASAYCLYQLGETNRQKVIDAYFSASAANYSLCRTHIGSCDFSLGHYSYAEKEDTALGDFNIDRDRKYLIPMIKAAQKASTEGFKLISSPWTAPPWMKSNGAWEAGNLLPQHYSTFSNYLLKYIQAYQKEEIPIWAITPENEPLGNDSNWDSMHFTKEQMAELLRSQLGPLLRDSTNTKILVFDQNRDHELIEWTNLLLKDPSINNLVDGTAIHWYASTVDPMTDAIDSVHRMAEDKLIIQSEACIDNDVPVWNNDSWYWEKNATDWGYTWAKEEDKYLHPKYAPTHRYASDIISTLNHWVNGWVDWNMILDRKGGPNHAENWCIAPIIADLENDEIYFTPLYSILTHFSKYIRPAARRINHKISKEGLLMTSFINPDQTIALVIFNPGEKKQDLEIKMMELKKYGSIEGNSIQTILLKKEIEKK